MTTVADPLKELAAQAALALRGHLTFLAEQGVDGLPAPLVKRAAPTFPVRAEAPRGKPATAPTPAPNAQAAAPAPQPAPAARTGGREVMPWERHLPGGAPAPAAAEPVVTALAPKEPAPPPRPAAPPPVVAAPRPPPPPVASAPALAKVAPAPAPAGPPPLLVVPRDPNAPRGQAGLTVVREDLGDCKRCKLHAGRTNLVFGVGSPTAEICFVGEGPGADEDLQGEPFVGRAGQLLTQMIQAMGLQRGDVYICNVVKCRPPNNRDPEPDEVAACSPFLIRQVRAVGPKVIVTLGKHAAHTLLNVKTPITRLRGTWGSFDGIPLMPTFHPSFLLRDPTQKKFAWEDLKAVLHHLGRPVPAPRKN